MLLHIIKFQFNYFVGLLTLTVGCSDNAREIFEESVRPLDEFLTSKSHLTKIPSVSVRDIYITL